jgi:RNA polymerase sigma-70 factor (ECF subfamily)
VAGESAEKKPDAALVAAMAEGEAQALRELSARYGASLLALVFRFLADQADAEEVVADVLWQAWREAALYDPARGSVAAWLVAMARSRAIDRLRAIRARRPVPGVREPDPQPAPDPSEELHGAERGRIVRQALEALEPKQRELLTLAYFSDLSQSEIAAQLNLPLGTVKTRMRAALFKLREMLGKLAE